MVRRRETPEERTLSPLVKEALAYLQPVPPPHPDRWEEARQAYVAEARAHLSDDQAFSGARDENGKERGAGLRAFLLSLGERRPRAMLARLAILLSVVFGGTLGTVEAAQRSLPGSALYPVKLQIEDLRTARTQDPQARIERLMQAAEERLEEAERLVRRGNDVPTELGERYAEELSLALEAMDGLSGAARNQAEARIAELLTGHVEAIRELGARLDADDAALGLMMAAVEEAASQLDGFDANVLDDDDMDVVGSDDDDDDGPDDDDADDDGSDDDDDGSDDHDDGDDDSDDDSDDDGDDDGSDDDDDGDDDSDDESDDDSDDDGDDDSDDDGDGDDDSDGDDAADDDDDGDDDGSDDDDDGDDDSDGDDDADDDDDGDDDGSDDDNDGDDHSDDDDADDADD